MPKKITVDAYTFDELDEKAKKKALEWALEALGFDDSDAEQLTDDFKDFLRHRGLADPEVHWSLSNCQGDGVAFEGVIDFKAMIANVANDDAMLASMLDAADAGVIADIAKTIEDCTKTMTENGEPDFIWDDYVRFTVSQSSCRYYHWNSMNVEAEIEYSLFNVDENEQAFEKIVKHVLETIDSGVKCISHRLEAFGYEQIDAINSDDMLIERIKDNGYLFTARGSRTMALYD